MGTITAILAITLAATQPAAAAPPNPPLEFAIRADPAIANRVNAVLERIAAPIVTGSRSGDKPQDIVNRACGGLASPEIIALQTTGTEKVTRVRHAPCLRYERALELTVEAGQTLATLATMLGLRASSFAAAQVRRSGDPSRWLRISPATLRVGDVVRFPLIPEWTRIRVDPSVPPDIQSLIRLFADAVGCGSATEECLLRQGLQILERNPRPAPATHEQDLPPEPQTELDFDPAVESAEALIGTPAGGELAAAVAGVAALDADPLPATAPPPSTPRVPDAQ